ncbi:MAG: PilZ domain-containing protein [Myxococcaceae bacterium]|jgi:hypothetical protein|nr:PilZ domain-containing protein [Myxococcaceae bacterium]MCA3014183.1 PilZ domain-containing protein [Myxococcaceae bacterium]
MKDRRSHDRRADRSVQFEVRRREERRDYPRFEVALDVREPTGPSRSCFGDLSPEGAAFVTSRPPKGDVVLLRMSLPNVEGPVVAAGRVVARTAVAGGTQVSVRFCEIALFDQLAIAEWAQERQDGRRAGAPMGRPIPLTRVASREWSRFKAASPLAQVASR